MIPAIQNLINYLNPTNAHRIVNLSPHDPFAIFGFILLALIVPISLLLLTVVARRSVYSIMDRVQHEGIYRRLRRSAKARERRAQPLLPIRRSGEVLGGHGGRVTLEREHEKEKEGRGGGKGKGVSFVDAAPKHPMPKQQQQKQAPIPSPTRPNKPTSTKKQGKEHRTQILPQTVPTRSPPIRPTQRIPNSPATAYVQGKPKTAVAGTQPPPASPPSPSNPLPSKPQYPPPTPSKSLLTSRKPTAVEKRPTPSSQTTHTNPSRSPIEPTFEELFDKWEAAQRAPRIDLVVEEDVEARTVWFVELQAELRGAGLRANLG